MLRIISTYRWRQGPMSRQPHKPLTPEEKAKQRAEEAENAFQAALERLKKKDMGLDQRWTEHVRRVQQNGSSCWKMKYS